MGTTVRGLYDYFYTNMIPGELFVPTAIMNGPHCRAVRVGNLRWINWAAQYSMTRTTTSYEVKSPGIINAKLARDLLDLDGPHLFARKLSWEKAPEAYSILDRRIE